MERHGFTVGGKEHRKVWDQMKPGCFEGRSYSMMKKELEKHSEQKDETFCSLLFHWGSVNNHLNKFYINDVII